MQKILLIEDDPDIISLVEDCLKVEGYEVLSANNGTLGIELALNENPDLIICDVMMEGFTGWDVIQRLSQDVTARHIPFFFLTAKSDRTDIRYGMQLGADDFITKPFDIDELLHTVKLRIEKYQAIKNLFAEQTVYLSDLITKTLPHEIRTPLNSIIGFSQLISHSINDLSKEEIKSFADNISNSASRLNELTANFIYYQNLLLNFKCDNNLVSHNVKNIIEMNVTVKSYKYEHIQLQMDVVDANLAICEERFGKLLEEVIDNAFKFSDGTKPVLISSELRNNEYNLRITNYGRTISQQQIATIGAFKQFDRDKFEQEGVGLGLAIIDLITKMYHGQMKIYSGSDNSTTIDIILPIYITNKKKIY